MLLAEFATVRAVIRSFDRLVRFQQLHGPSQS
jgi:hypothetical protein